MTVRIRTVFALLVVLGAPLAARATTCPEVMPENSTERRGLAKEFFSRAEQAENGGDDLAAVKAYQCSLKMVPHAFTAYNLGRVAEKSGDLDLALRSFRVYLTMKPDAPDQKEIEARMVKLEERIATVRAAAADEDRRSVATPPVETTPITTPVEPPTTPEPPHGTATRDDVESHTSDEPRPMMGTREWAIAGVGVAALAGGLALNVMARAKMKDCRRLHDMGMKYDSTCDAAKPLAYGSYGLLGVAAAALVVDAALIWQNRSSVESVAVTPLPGGVAFSTSLRF
jgi:tetratricopeptide (TPR) repeat protein